MLKTKDLCGGRYFDTVEVCSSSLHRPTTFRISNLGGFFHRVFHKISTASCAKSR